MAINGEKRLFERIVIPVVVGSSPISHPRSKPAIIEIGGFLLPLLSPDCLFSSSPAVSRCFRFASRLGVRRG